MIEGRGRDFDRSLLRGRRMRRQNLAQQFPFASHHEILIVERIDGLLVSSAMSFSSRKNSSNQAICDNTCKSVKSWAENIFGILGRVAVFAKRSQSSR